MTDKKQKIMSLSVPPEMQQELKDAAKKLGISVSQLVRDLVERYLHLMMNDGDDTKILLKIPNYLKEEKEELRNWLSTKVEALVDALTK